MPRTGPRVVCTLWVTIETLAPTSALTSVDLPLLGAPISATKTQRALSASGFAGGLGIRRRLPHSLAHEHGKSGRLLGGSLVRPLPPLRSDAVDLHLCGEARHVIQAFAG